ncbi:hypothetical protein ACFPVX_09485 [Cohnella faecalis]|uniref:Uncharacterized protein n=1 Tax=Cohnella faecalis TaxID=2315694 RepID=A0A398CIN1_9BACL|nr:hypothetical protein [Cohnella faecalis]RIE01932.1 hypothetical protein D3H35_14250 [Cohnella faecalis]
MQMKNMSRTLKWISVVIIALGILCCIWNISQFNDRNLGLMVGIGFLVGGAQILIFGTIAPLMQKRQDEERLPESLAKDPV